MGHRENGDDRIVMGERESRRKSRFVGWRTGL